MNPHAFDGSYGYGSSHLPPIINNEMVNNGELLKIDSIDLNRPSIYDILGLTLWFIWS